MNRGNPPDRRWRIADGRWRWDDADGGVQVRFVGRPQDPPADDAGRPPDRVTELAAATPAELGHAWAKQVHSATVLTVSGAGLAGAGDALVTGTPGLALSVVTADCVPVLIAAGVRLAAIHAGWRGIAAGVVAATVRRLTAEGAPPTERWVAWLGPAIGGCCYEVGPDVAERVAAASTPDAVLDWPGADRPHLDLLRAVSHQLAAAGVAEMRPMIACTRCDAERLWSYRRDGEAAGRNLALAWRQG